MSDNIFSFSDLDSESFASLRLEGLSDLIDFGLASVGTFGDRCNLFCVTNTDCVCGGVVMIPSSSPLRDDGEGDRLHFDLSMEGSRSSFEAEAILGNSPPTFATVLS